MAFDEVRLPLRLKYGSGGGPRFMTDVVIGASGAEYRNQRWAQARRTYDARTGVMSAADAALLTAFFHARAGRARGFRLKDWSDFSSAADGRGAARYDDQPLGVGDGARRTFQLVKTYGDEGFSHERVIAKPVSGSVRVGVDGVELTGGWSVDFTCGLVIFDVPPAVGAKITAGFLFDVPVRFDTDVLSLTAEDKNLAQVSVPVIEVRA